MSRCASHSRPREGSASARKGHRRHHPSPHERPPFAFQQLRVPCTRATTSPHVHSAAAAPATSTACRAVPRTADQEREAPVLVRDTGATILLLKRAPLALPANTHSPHAGDHLATRAYSASRGCTCNYYCLSRCASHRRTREGSTPARQRHRRHHPSPHECTPCHSSKCAHPTRRRPLPAALRRAQSTKRGKHQRSHETPTPTSLSP